MTIPRIPSYLVALLAAAAVAVSCKDRTDMQENPFFSAWDTPFGVPPFDRIEVHHYLPAFEAAMKEERAEIDSITLNPAAPTFGNVIAAFDRSGSSLDRVSRVFSLLSAAVSTPEMRQVQEKVYPLLSQHSDAIMHDPALFDKVKAVYENRTSETLEPDQLRLLEKTYRNFVRAGSLLSPGNKDELKKINEQLSLLSVRFGNNLLAENKRFVLELDSAQIEGLPASLLIAAREEAEKRGLKSKWAVTLDNAIRIPFLQYSDHRDLREKVYLAYIGRGNHGNEADNKQIVNDIVRLRTDRAHLLGHPTHADYVLEERMAKTPENVYGLLDDLWMPALKRAMAELSDLKRLRRNEGGGEDFQAWDWWFYAEKVRKQKYSLDDEALRPYFPLESVRNGIFALSNRLYGVTFRPVTLPVYHPECKTYEVLDRDNSHLGILYLDFFPRDGKQSGAWCGQFRSQSRDADGNRVSPIVSIVCNFTRPFGRRPALLTLEETTTFFHEFGHALHNFFLDVRYRGIERVERDFVELPSQLMENWAFEPDVLRQYAFHYSSGKVIPDYLIDRIRKSQLFNQGFETLEYLAAACSDMDIHHMPEFTELDLNAFEKKILNEQRGLIPEIAPRYRFPYFAHIFDGGYSAGYYSYIWSGVLDKDAYEAFVETGDIFNRSVALRFRAEVLSKGGSADGMTLYENFRGQEPSRLPLLRSRGLIGEE